MSVTVFVVLLFVSVIILGPIVIGVMYSLSKRRAVNKQELQALRNDIARIRVDIGEIKEQIADFIIKTH
jgi:uncharacterized membrane protein (DUF106 family)